MKLVEIPEQKVKLKVEFEPCSRNANRFGWGERNGGSCNEQNNVGLKTKTWKVTSIFITFERHFHRMHVSFQCFDRWPHVDPSIKRHVTSDDLVWVMDPTFILMTDYPMLCGQKHTLIWSCALEQVSILNQVLSDRRWKTDYWCLYWRSRYCCVNLLFSS